jgi:hypothetical protein
MSTAEDLVAATRCTDNHGAIALRSSQRPSQPSPSKAHAARRGGPSLPSDRPNAKNGSTWRDKTYRSDTRFGMDSHVPYRKNAAHH